MDLKPPQVIRFEFEGKELEVKASHDLFMAIEERVSFSKLATLFVRQGAQMTIEVPISHVAWIMWVLLARAGRGDLNAMEVQHLLAGGAVSWGPVLSQLISAFFGPAPKYAEKKSEEPRKKRSPKAKTSSRRSRPQT